jgi:hypothetical protein
MRPSARMTSVSAMTCLILGAMASGTAQTTDFLGKEAALGPIVRGAPYSADAVTTLTHTLGDGTRIERTMAAKLYRDSAGRIRREQTVLGLASLSPSSDAEVLITIVDPVAGMTHVLDPRTGTARRMAIDRRMLGGAPPPPPSPPGRPARGIDDAAAPPPPPPAPPRPEEEALGTAVIAGIKVSGRRSRTTIPAGHIGNDRAIEISDERWNSPELRLLAQSRHSDPRTGVIEYRLVNISRVEPPAELFEVPAGYTVVNAPPPPPPAPRQGR